MSKESANGAPKKLKVVFGSANYNEKENELEMPPKNALEKNIEDQKENMVEIVVHKNTREILEKLEKQQGITH